MDGHSTHVSDPDVLQYAVDNDVVMVSIPPHTSHYLQPLDRSFFRSLKTHYYSACNYWVKQHPERSITKLQFGMLLSQAWGKACSVENGVNGFRACGLVPLNPDIIPESAYAPSQLFHNKENEAEGQDEQELTPGPSEERLLQMERESNPGTSSQVSKELGGGSKKRLRTPPPADSSQNESYEGSSSSEDDVPLLHRLCPLPNLPKRNKTGRSQKATILTSPEHIRERRARKQAKINPERKQKRALAHTEGDSRCGYCDGLFSEDHDGQVWICCTECATWFHEQCAGACGASGFVCEKCT